MTKKKTTVGGGEANKLATRRVRVDQETIDVMLKQAERLPPSRPFPEFPESIDRLCPGSRAKLARVAAGYAEVELLPEELTDYDDDEGEPARRRRRAMAASYRRRGGGGGWIGGQLRM